MTKREAMISTYREVAAKHRGAYLTREAFFRESGLSMHNLAAAGFDNYSNLVHEGGGIPPTNQALDPKILLLDWIRVAKEVGRVPAKMTYAAKGKFSPSTVENRVGGGKWTRVAALAAAHAEESGDEDLLAIVSATPARRLRGSLTPTKTQPIPTVLYGNAVLSPEPLAELSAFTSEAQEGAREMAKYYSRLYCLERQMRSIIVRTLEGSHSADWWEQCVPDAIKASAVDNRRGEKKEGVTPRSESQIDYTTLGELGGIVYHNWEHFSTVFDDRQAMQRIMFRLNLLRVFVMHCTRLPPDEVTRLDLTINDWLRQLKAN